MSIFPKYSPGTWRIYEQFAVFEVVQELIGQGVLTAYHDRSDGGLITTVIEMCLAGNCGARLDLSDQQELVSLLFNEEAGMVIECLEVNESYVRSFLEDLAIPVSLIGWTDQRERGLTIRHGDVTVFAKQLTTLRRWWEATSIQLELHQANPETVRQEAASFGEDRVVEYHINTIRPKPISKNARKPMVAVLREEGSNGDREMAAAYMAAGFEVTEVAMSDLRSGTVHDLDQFQGLAKVGGFSYADVFGSAKGWAGSILFNKRLRDMFNRFYDREDTFTLGVCNGCQLMANIGWLPYRGLPTDAQPRFVHNTSGRFESRWSAVKVLPSPSIMLRDMQGSVLGIHVAHGEGKMVLPDLKVAEEIREKQLVPLAFVGVDGMPTEVYPYNPNGSPNGSAGMTSPDGRHLIMMPHPERCFLEWQWPWMPREWRASFVNGSPWLQMFDNARSWCLEHS